MSSHHSLWLPAALGRKASFLIGLLAVALLGPVPSLRAEERTPEVIWRGTLDCSCPGWPDAWWAYDIGAEDYRARLRQAGRTGEEVPAYKPPPNLCPEWFAVEEMPDAPRGKAIRISGPVRVTTWSAPGQKEGTLLVFSASMKAEPAGLAVTLYTDAGSRTVRLTEKWTRHSVTIPHPKPLRWSGFNFGFVGTSDGTVWAAGPQMEKARPVAEARAKHWERTFSNDYALETEGPHAGKWCIRLDPGQGTMAVQTLVFEEPVTDALELSAWGRVKKFREGHKIAPALICLELYGPVKDAVTPPEVGLQAEPQKEAPRKAQAAQKDPFRAVRLAFDSDEWQEKTLTTDPTETVGRSEGQGVVKVRVIAMNPNPGTASYDDLSLTVLGEEKLGNGGFEEHETKELFSQNCKPSPYCEPLRSRFSEHYPRPPEATCPVVEAQPVIDGSLDDPCWQKATVLDRLVEIGKGAPANPAIRCSVCRDENTLFVGYEWDFAKDQFNDASAARPREEGERQPDGPVVGVLLKPELLHPGREFFDFAISPDGTKREGKGFEHRFGAEAIKYFKGGWKHKGWGFYEDEFNNPWEAKVRRSEKGWTAELAIPISSVEVSLGNDFWGVNFWAKTASGVTFAWSPTYQVKLPGKFYGPLWDHHVCRTKGTDYYYGVLRGMKGMRARVPYEGMIRVIDSGFVPRPGGGLAALAEVRSEIPLADGALDARAIITIVDVDEALKKINQREDTGENAAVDKEQAHQIALEMDMQRILQGVFDGIWGYGETRATAVRLEQARTLIRIDGYQSPWKNGKRYRVRVVLTPLDGKTILVLKDRTVRIEDRYSSLLAPARIRVQHSLYVDDQAAKVLVESSVPEKTEVSLGLVSKDGALQELRLIGDHSVSPGGKRYVAFDLASVPMGFSRLQAQLKNAAGETLAVAYDQLHRRPPSPYGFTRIDRVTGCLEVNGQPLILRSGVRAAGNTWGGSGPESVAPLELNYNAVMGIPPSAEKLRHVFIPWLHNHKLNEQTVQRLVGRVRELKTNPNIVAWKLVDEPYGGAGICRRYWELAREEDPYRPHYQVSGPIDTEIKVAGGYCFGLGRKWSTPWNYSLEFNAMKFHYAGRAAREKGLPVYSWYSFIQGGCSEGRMPTPDELRCQIYHGVIYGVRNIMYWVGRSPYGPLLERLREVHAELEVFQGFLAGEDVVPLFIDRKDGIHLALWRSSEGLCLLADNSTPFAVSTELDVAALAGKPKQMDLRFGRQDCARLRDGNVSISFGGYERAMLFLR